MAGNQDIKRATLASKLKELWSSAPEISYNMNVKSGIFRVAVSDTDMIGYLNDQPIKSIKIEDLDEELREALKNDPEKAGVLFMEELINAHKEGKIAMDNKIIKEAKKAGDNDVKDQLSGITERQLKDAGPLYERQEEERKDISEKQLGETRKEYENTKRQDEEQKSITEKQIESGKNPKPDTSPREDKERDQITQKQLEKDSDVNGRRDDEKVDITEKQMDKDFRNDELKAITEKQLDGTEQKNDKVLVRRLSNKEEALKFASAVAKSIAKFSIKNEIPTEKIISDIKTSIKNFSSQNKLASMIKKAAFENAEETVDLEEPTDVAADVLGDEEVGGTYETDLIMNALRSLIENPKFQSMIDEAINSAKTEETEVNKTDEDYLNEALTPEDEGTEPVPTETEEIPGEDMPPEEDEDGLIAVEGDMGDLAGAEDVEKAAFAHARKVVGEQIAKAEDFAFEINEKDKTYRAIFAFKDRLNVDSPVVKDILAKRASTREAKIAKALENVKTAQTMPAGGGMPGAAPMGEPAGGGGTTLPPGPASDLAGTPPPVQSLDQGAAPADGGDLGGPSEDFEPTPPGTRCPACGSDDVDVEGGKFECNNCKSEGTISISLDVSKWSGTLEETEGEKGEGEGTPVEGEPEAVPGAEEAAGMGAPPPMVASVYTIDKRMIKKAIETGQGYFRVGEYCPNCGSDNTDVDSIGNGKCFNCSQAYVAKFSAKDGKYKGLSIWMPVTKKPDCPECKAKAIMAKLNTQIEKTAAKYEDSKKPETVNTQDSYMGYQFPYKKCVEKLARRYGINAIALSGDCAGKSLVDCVCGKMKKANRYSEVLMMKLASRLTEKDPMEECVEDYVRQGIDMKEACTQCEELKKKALMEFPEEEETEQVASETPECCGEGVGLAYDVDKFEQNEVELDPMDELIQQITRLVETMREVLGKDGPEGIGEEVVGPVDEIELELGEDGIASEKDMMTPGQEGEEDVVEFELGDDEGEQTVEDNNVEFKSEEDKTEQDEGHEEKETPEFERGEQEEEKEDSEKEESPEHEEKETPEFERGEQEEKKEKKEEKESCMSEEEKGVKLEKENNKEEEMKESIAKNMSDKKVKRYSDKDSLKSLTVADTMQINDLTGQREIGKSPSEKEVKVERPQDTSDIGKVQDGKTMGSEPKFDAKDPDVPRGNAKMGEGESMPEGKAKVPAGSGAMRKEKDIVDTNVSTESQGNVATANAEQTVKTAGEKKVEEPKPVCESKDLKNQKLCDNQIMGKENETKLSPETLKEPDVPRGEAKMGPDESKEFAKPSIPAGGGGMGHEQETVGTEVTVETKGTVIADQNKEIKEAEVKAERVTLATKLAALELLDGAIEESEYEEEVKKLSSSSIQTIKTLIDRYQKQRSKKTSKKEEKVEKVSATSVGLQTPLVIEKTSERDTLKDQIQGLFSLDQKIKGFEENK